MESANYIIYVYFPYMTYLIIFFQKNLIPPKIWMKNLKIKTYKKFENSSPATTDPG